MNVDNVSMDGTQKKEQLNALSVAMDVRHVTENSALNVFLIITCFNISTNGIASKTTLLLEI